MCSYLATDLNCDHNIETKELSSLLWLSEGAEPSKARVERELKAMDADLSGTISMMEWIKYLITFDSVVIILMLMLIVNINSQGLLILTMN